MHRKGGNLAVVMSFGLTTVEGELGRVVCPKGQVHFPCVAVIVKVEVRFLPEALLQECKDRTQSRPEHLRNVNDT